MPTERERRFVGPRRGQLYFALAFVVVSLVLLALIGDQTRWTDNTRLFAQPRFWPAIGLLGMVVLGGIHLLRLPWRRNTPFDRREAIKWATALEFALWFMGYVLLVPILGYLPVTVVFVPALAWRMGYRSRQMIGISVVFAIFVVVLFKSLLAVKIPGAAVYEYLPDNLRSFFILNF